MTKSKDKTIEERVRDAIEELRPFINMDGGDIEFVKYLDDIVYVKLSGACSNCMYTDDTINNGVYETLKQDIPEIKGVINVKI